MRMLSLALTVLLAAGFQLCSGQGDGTPSDCSPVLCTLFCENGFQRDENGCRICRCNPECTRNFRCFPSCIERGADGCPTCNEDCNRDQGVVQESEAPGSYTSTQRAAIIRKKQESADGQRAKRPRPMLTQDIETMRAESMEEDVEIEEGEEEATRVESDVEIEEEEEEETAQSSGIKVLSYNIEQFGLTKYEKVWIRNTIFRIICEFDVVFIMEVKNSLEESVLKDNLNGFLKSQQNKDSGKLANCLQENLENGYNIKSSPMLPASGSNLIQERYFFIYAADKFDQVTLITYSGHSTLRPPYIFTATETVSKLDTKITIIGFHAQADSVKTPLDLKLLKAVYTEHTRSSSNRGSEPIILIGDFNADCTYLSRDNKAAVTEEFDGFCWPLGVPGTGPSTNLYSIGFSNHHCGYDKIIANDAAKICVKERGRYPSSKIYAKIKKELNLQESPPDFCEGPLIKAVSNHLPIQFTFNCDSSDECRYNEGSRTAVSRRTVEGGGSNGGRNDDTRGTIVGEEGLSIMSFNIQQLNDLKLGLHAWFQPVLIELFRKHDVILIQEIKSSLVAETMSDKIKVSPKGGFEEFMTKLNKGGREYKVEISPLRAAERDSQTKEPTNFLKAESFAYIYNSKRVTLTVDDRCESAKGFSREPFCAIINFKKKDDKRDFSETFLLIGVHLTQSGDTKMEMDKLEKFYTDTLRTSSKYKDAIIMGDFNSDNKLSLKDYQMTKFVEGHQINKYQLLYLRKHQRNRDKIYTNVAGYYREDSRYIYDNYILAADYTKIQDSSRIFKCVTPSNIIVNSHEKQLEMFQKYYIELVTTKALGSDGPKLPDDCERELLNTISDHFPISLTLKCPQER